MGTPTNWYKKFSFVIEIDGIARAAFKTCSDLRVNADTVAYREGGRLNPHKSPGLVEFPPITLERGKTNDFDLYNWMKDTFDAAAGTGLVTPDLYRNFDIVQLDRKGDEVERWTVYDAWCKEFGAGDWDNDASETGLEQVVVECDRWERVPA
jgi:phage tail-like protein